MAITNKEEGVWILDEVYNKINEGDIWDYTEVYDFFSWGYGTGGRLGQGNNTNYSSPRQIPGTTWASASRSTVSGQARGTKTDGTMWVWGNNAYGNLGLNSQTTYDEPVQLGSDTNWAAFDPGTSSAGQNFSMYVKTDGTMFGAGRNNSGQIGVNDKTDRSSPIQVGGEDGWSSVSCCYSSTAAIKTDNTLWTWGSGSYGKLGHNQSNTGYSSPKQVGTDTTWSIITGNGNFAAIKTNGTLWSWGFNREGQLGHNTQSPSGTFASVSSPKQIPGTWSEVSTMREGAFAINTSGELYSWGRNQYGELGLNQGGGPMYKSSPTQVGTDTTWSKVSAGTYTCYGLKTDNTLWSWGRNLSGAGGFNDGGNKYSSPVQIPGTWVQVAAGGSSAGYALKIT